MMRQRHHYSTLQGKNSRKKLLNKISGLQVMDFLHAYRLVKKLYHEGIYGVRDSWSFLQDGSSSTGILEV